MLIVIGYLIYMIIVIGLTGYFLLEDYPPLASVIAIVLSCVPMMIIVMMWSHPVVGELKGCV